MAHKPIIRHFELSKMSDDNLLIEAGYTASQCEKASAAILLRTNATYSICLHAYTTRDSFEEYFAVPLSKMHENLQIHTDRLDAILQEIEFRRIP